MKFPFYLQPFAKHFTAKGPIKRNGKASPSTDREALVSAQDLLSAVGSEALEKLLDSDNFKFVSTSGFYSSAGVRGRLPKDLWVSIILNRLDDFVGMPQIYAIFSPHGVELGFAAAIYPNDFSDTSVKAKPTQITSNC